MPTRLYSKTNAGALLLTSTGSELPFVLEEYYKIAK
jgi:hypothetical protein